MGLFSRKAEDTSPKGDVLRKQTPAEPAKGRALGSARRAFASVRAEFYEDLAESLDDRAVLVDYLEKHMLRAKANRSNLSGLYALWLRRMDTLSFSGALRGTVPTMDSMVLLAAEASGNLPQGLRFLTFSVRSVAKIRSTIIMAITMPVVVLAMITGMMYGFGAFMVPILSSIVQVEHWPWMGRVMYGASMFVLHYGLYMFAGIGALVAAVMWALPNWSGPTRAKYEGVFPFSLYRDYNSAVMLVSLSGLMQSGTSLVGSLKAIRTSSPPWLSWHMSQALRRLDKLSATPGKAFDTGLMPKELYERVLDYGERSSFQSALKKIGNQSLENLDKAVQKKAKVVNQVLLALSGTIMAMVIGSVMLTAQQARVELSSRAASSGPR
jgi:type II secretory pathway component PulF